MLASSAALAPALGARTVVVTSDRDAFALIDDTTTVLRIINGGVDTSPLMTAAGSSCCWGSGRISTATTRRCVATRRTTCPV